MDRTFPESTPPPLHQPTPVEIVVPRRVLADIFQALGISIHAVVNGPRHRGIVRDLYRISRRIEAESWLRGHLQEIADEDWIRRHL